MKLWLLRHAPVLLPPGLCYGRSDVAADPLATQAAALQFAPQPGPGCAVWASPLQRTRQLALALAQQRPDLPAPLWDARLREMDFGQWEMQAWADIGQAAVDAWVANFAHHQCGGGESTQAVVDRVAAALHQAKALALDELVWVTHAGVAAAVQFLTAAGAPPGITSAQQWPTDRLPYGGYMKVFV